MKTQMLHRFKQWTTCSMSILWNTYVYLDNHLKKDAEFVFLRNVHFRELPSIILHKCDCFKENKSLIYLMWHEFEVYYILIMFFASEFYIMTCISIAIYTEIRMRLGESCDSALSQSHISWTSLIILFE